ncbi:MAG: glycosyltransferase family 1 protein, partial [Thermodesulfobacteriota bacterium]
MRVAFPGDLIDHSPMTGQIRYSHYLISGLSDSGVDVTLLYADLPESSIYEGIKKESFRISGLPLLNETIRSKLANRKAGDFDIFHDTTNYGMPLGRSKAKKIITLHDVGTERLPEFYRDYTVKKMERVREIVTDVDAVITVSEFQKREIAEVYGLSEDKIFVVYHGIDTGKFRGSSGSPLIECEYIMYLGSLVPKKGLLYLLRAFNEVKDKLPHKLLFAGVRGFKSEAVFELIERLGLGSRVVVKENSGDAEVVNYLSNASLFVYPSLYEGFGFPPLEAMATGTPVITSRNSSLLEIYEDSALLVDP